MDKAVPVSDGPPGGSIERRRRVRWPVLRPIVGQALPLDRPVILRTISGVGFSGVAAVNLTLGAVYELHFALESHSVVAGARLVNAARISGDQATVHLLGFEFVDTQRDAAAIAALLAQATMDAVDELLITQV